MTRNIADISIKFFRFHNLRRLQHKHLLFSEFLLQVGKKYSRVTFTSTKAGAYLAVATKVPSFVSVFPCLICLSSLFGLSIFICCLAQPAKKNIII